MTRGYLSRKHVTVRQNINTQAYTLTIPSKLIHEIESTFQITFPVSASLVLTLDNDGQPRLSLTNMTSTPPSIKRPRKQLNLPEGYTTWGSGRGGSGSTMNLKRFGNQLYTRQEAEEAGQHWDSRT